MAGKLKGQMIEKWQIRLQFGKKEPYGDVKHNKRCNEIQFKSARPLW